MLIQKQFSYLAIPGMTSLIGTGSFFPPRLFCKSSIVSIPHGFILTPLLYFGPIVSLVLVSLVLIVLFSIKEGKKRQLSRAIRFITNNPPMAISSLQVSDSIRKLQSVEYQSVMSFVILQSADKALIGQRFDFSKGITSLGSSSTNDLFSPMDFGAKKGHALITFCNGHYFIAVGKPQDNLPGQLNTSAGIFVNDTPVAGEMLINQGDLIRLGDTLLLRFE